MRKIFFQFLYDINNRKIIHANYSKWSSSFVQIKLLIYKMYIFFTNSDNCNIRSKKNDKSKEQEYITKTNI